MFYAELRQRLKRFGSRVLLRVAIRGRVEEFTAAQILTQAEALAARYDDAPERGVVLLLLPHSAELFFLHLGLILRNRVPAILAWPTSRVDREKYQRNLAHQLRNLPASQLIALPGLAQNLKPALPYITAECPIQTGSSQENNFPPFDLTEPPPKAAASRPAPDDAVFLQFSGGTTGAQKAVVVTAPMLQHQLERLAEALAFSDGDSVASWLPLYHDMGLIACFWFPLWHGAPSLQFSASEWLLNPELLFQYAVRYQATFCWLPNFAFSYLAAQKDRMQGNYRLDHVRGWISCSEPVRQASMNAFAAAFGDWGMRANALQASYAMAENVFAVTQTMLGQPPPTFPRSAVNCGGAISYHMLEEVYVSSGKAIPGVEIAIGDNGPGEIRIRTESLFQGYWGTDGFVTNSISSDGWYATGDYGFLAGGELYVIGRIKDIVIVGGQNVFPEDVEAIVNTLPGVYPGRVVAFGVDDAQHGTETLAVVAELRGQFQSDPAQALETEIQRLVLSAIGIAPRVVWVVPERWIVKSTAGKISRRETRSRFLRERDRRAYA